MNKQEAIELLHDVANRAMYRTGRRSVHIDKIVELVNEIDETQKPKVSRVAVEFYEKYKDEILSLDEWFGDFYSKEAIEDFPGMEELTEWLHGNDNDTNRRRELALATLVTLGIDAVEIEQEKLYTVEIPNPNRTTEPIIYLSRDEGGKIFLNNWFLHVSQNWKNQPHAHLTESEIKQDFEWAFQFAKEVEAENDGVRN